LSISRSFATDASLLDPILITVSIETILWSSEFDVRYIQWSFGGTLRACESALRPLPEAQPA
jgi:hypothetical protein